MAKGAQRDWGLLWMRLGYATLMFGFHGYARFFRAWNFVVHRQPWTFVSVVQRLGFPFPSVFAVLSALSESICPLCIGLGFYTRWAAVILGFDMAVAFYNEAIKWNSGGTPELPAFYLIGAIYFVIRGSGPLALDSLMPRRGTSTARAR